MFVAISKFTIANDMVDEVRAAFQARPHMVDAEAGFLRMEVMSPSGLPHEVWLLTYWQDEASFRAWHKSHNYQKSHHAIPKGLKLIPEDTELRFFDVFAH